MLFSSFWERWFSPASPWRRKAVPRRARRQWNNLGYEWLEDRRMLMAVSEVQAFSTSQYQSSQTSIAVNVPTAIDAGHTIFVEVAIDNFGTVSVSDSAGNTYTKDADNTNGFVNVRTIIFRASGVAALAANSTITVTVPSGSTAKAIAVQEFSGLSSSPKDQTIAGQGNKTNVNSGNTANTNQANELLLGAVGMEGPPWVSFTPGTGLTSLSSAGTSGGGNNETMFPEYEIVSATGAYAATATIGTGDQWDAIAYTYKADLTTKYAISSVPATATAGTAFNITVTAQQAGGSTDTTYTGTVQFTSTDGIAGLPSDYTFTTADAGVHTFSVTLKTAGSQTVTATDEDDGTIAKTSSSITVNAASASSLTVSGPASATAGTSFSNLTVTAKDTYGNTATGYTGTVQFTSTDGQAVLPGNYTFVGGDAGSHTFTVKLKTAGNKTVTATDTVTGTITGTSSSISVSAASTSTFSFSTPGSATAGTSFNVTVTATDAYGNTTSGYTGTVHFTSSDGQAVLPSNYAFVGGDAGAHTFSATLKTSGNQTVTATDTVTGTINGTSSNVNVSAASAASFTVSAPASSTAGNSFNVTVTAKDA